MILGKSIEEGKKKKESATQPEDINILEWKNKPEGD